MQYLKVPRNKLNGHKYTTKSVTNLLDNNKWIFWNDCQNSDLSPIEDLGQKWKMCVIPVNHCERLAEYNIYLPKNVEQKSYNLKGNPNW